MSGFAVQCAHMIAVFIGIIGLCLGSFFNALAYRIGTNQSIVRGRSQCPQCKNTIAWYDLIPVLSFLWLRAKCRTCRQPISWQYPVVEMVTAAVLLGLYVRFSVTSEFWLAAATMLFLIPVFLTDWRYYLIPDSVSVTGLVVVAGLQLWFGASVKSLLFGVLVGAGFFAWQYVLSRGRWIGAGDIRLGALMGAALGVSRTLVALFLAYIGGAVVALILIARGQKKAGSHLPFGTFLVAATFVALLYGAEIAAAYRHLANF